MMVAMCSKTRGIGTDGKMTWYKPKDLAYFRKMTKDRVVIMGRKTWESLPEKHKPLKDRINVVVSRTMEVYKKGMIVFKDVYSALDFFDDSIVIGGGTLYDELIDNADLETIYITKIDNVDQYLYDTFFPVLPSHFKLVESKKEDDITFETYKRTYI